ncbi:N-acetylglucosamine-6-phosphate deacetylase [Clostridium saccharobutylicum]|uniref:N-acetylglucosamine-6-phosphate deacetylase n=1 Tax=Clostridium saccharobutylicum TaxID=169679 RepID=UPI000983EDFA|nr:N-acetylglucosamine-6-phosphate deacetylase [Clostridium saccharobutylicum]AQS08885.1 N-acetylglucosamine-6-phosphate deacetylase [Clostridium saccharobutylicum]MBC2437678.1 N-acetylglucosamine-6-phosphate deacetylase [Clostridium saccharobutylicum]NSB90083.1 N-acetylglucosamine-6-phosphate deacetylase [Clostridium saccharobutylicum]NYC28766.1 N-acetylglucosamine-6-phosphate deacetylase [Clostridium saccharobutylicum]OOM17921.1 N-acetylglucosamine-6-phosphate deacetylase [Clostridium saccha
MIIKNCNIIYLNKIEQGSIRIENGKIKEINPSKCCDEDILDANGLYVSPGFIDVHIHGAGGYDTMDSTSQAINTISKTIAVHGTTAFTPTTMTVSIEDIRKSLNVIKNMKEIGCDGAHVLGANLEGPFVSPSMLGAQNPKYLLPPSISTYKKIVQDYEDIIVSMTLAPEIEGSKELIRYISDTGVICSLGHTNATYKDMIEAIKCGASHSTHLYNRMTPLNHRDPGAVGAIFDSNLTTETISDGIHITYAALRIAYKQKGTDNVLLISDAMMACCMPNGKYSLGGQKVIVNNNEARLENGALAGSVLTLDKAVRNVYKNSNLPLHEIVKMASFNGAKHCKVDDHKGQIKEGYDADLILFDDDINIKKVFILGKEIL